MLAAAVAGVVILMASGCSRNTDKGSGTLIPLYRDVARFGSMTGDEKHQFLMSDSAELNTLTEYLGLGEADESTLARLAGSEAMKVFAPAVDSVFPTLKNLSGAIDYIIRNGNALNLGLPRRHYAAVVWGNSKSIVLTDSCALIALNHFLGSNYAGYTGWPAYIRDTKTPGQIPYALCEALVATSFPYNGREEPTVLSRMVYEGVLTLAKLRMVHDAGTADALGYTAEQMKWLDKNATWIWQSLVGQDLLYSTSVEVADRLMSPSPATSILAPDCPGRAGRYLGLRIARHAVDTKRLELRMMLQPEFYNNPSLLIETQFNLK